MDDGVSPTGLDIRAFEAWLGARAPELRGDGPLSARLLTGGLSNLTYRIRGAADPLVLRRPPLGHVLSTAHDMAREHRVQSALNGTAVPVPKQYLWDADADGSAGVGTEFTLMEYVEGEILDDLADNTGWTSEELRGVSFALIRTLAELHSIEPAAVGLADFGRPDGFLERNLRRWATQYQGNRFRELPELDRLLKRLGAGVPATLHSSLVHGDYRLDNVIVQRSADGPRIAAVLDWEMATLGDSLTDLGLLGLYWDIAEVTGDSPVSRTSVDPAAGYPGFDELLDAYAEARGIEVPQLGWYTGFAAAKLAIILEGIQLRHDQGETLGAGFDHVGELVPLLAAAGLRRLEGVRA
ncbi:phosphotransferase family protein [Protaetiibacter intestinalis]|uniref:Phosphotransferase family protein n=1 Tax=Protaetiibacter intestinalis TaxID=2419774 RepID=A0A387BAV4_9MICO|nr:phosphotransferase family protein [Protaetiibacter intestinalis]AYF98276.1 phosphotransferase family protein [Protaetiibacter intestinalis]